MALNHTHPVDAERVAAVRKEIISTNDAGRLAGLLGLIRDPVRLRVLLALSTADELCVGDLALALDTTDDAVSYALKLLRMSGLLVNRKQGRVVFYSLSEKFPHELLAHCLWQLLKIAAPEED